jgi:predicted nucleotidyltransferase
MAVLFGSPARRAASPRSDVDIGLSGYLGALDLGVLASEEIGRSKAKRVAMPVTWPPPPATRKGRPVLAAVKALAAWIARE